MKKEKLTLVITHHIFLTKKQRYSLVNGESISVIGISLPVWFDGQSGYTTEPAVEVFCKYKICKNEKSTVVKTTKLGYEINIPFLLNNQEKLPDELWRKMSFDEQEKWYQDNTTPPNVENLRDIADGGAEYLRLEELKKVKSPITADVIHSVEIKTIEALENSFIQESV
jgi:hypothetical protein